MAYKTQTNMLVAYNNVVTPELVTAVTLTNATADSGFPESNLKYPAPKREMRVSTTNANDRVIRFDFASAVTVSCMGICYHNLISAGYDNVKVEYSADGSAWSNVGTGTVSLAGSSNADNDFLIRFDAVSGVTHWRVTLGKTSGTRPAFYVGMIFLGVFYELVRNPSDGEIAQEIDLGLAFEEDDGSGTWLAPGSSSADDIVDFTLSWSRLTQFEARFLRFDIGRANKRRIVAIVGPEQASTSMPIGQEHFFGYMTHIVTQAVSGYGPTVHKYHATARFHGAK